MRVTFLFMDQA